MQKNIKIIEKIQNAKDFSTKIKIIISEYQNLELCKALYEIF